MKYAMKFDTLGASVMTPLLAGRRHSRLEVTDTDVKVRLGWAFAGDIPRSSITGARTKAGRKVVSRGAHGWSGRWLVNGAGDGLVVIDVVPAAKVRARVTGVPVHVRELTVSVEDPEGLVAALS